MERKSIRHRLDECQKNFGDSVMEIRTKNPDWAVMGRESLRDHLDECQKNFRESVIEQTVDHLRTNPSDPDIIKYQPLYKIVHETLQRQNSAVGETTISSPPPTNPTDYSDSNPRTFYRQVQQIRQQLNRTGNTTMPSPLPTKPSDHSNISPQQNSIGNATMSSPLPTNTYDYSIFNPQVRHPNSIGNTTIPSLLPTNPSDHSRILPQLQQQIDMAKTTMPSPLPTNPFGYSHLRPHLQQQDTIGKITNPTPPPANPSEYSQIKPQQQQISSIGKTAMASPVPTNPSHIKPQLPQQNSIGNITIPYPCHNEKEQLHLHDKKRKFYDFDNAALRNKQTSNLGGSSTPTLSSSKSKASTATLGENIVGEGTPKLREKANNIGLDVMTGDNKGNRANLVLNKELVSNGSNCGSVVKKNKCPMFRDLAGMAEVIKELNTEVLLPLKYSRLARWMGVPPASGILLHGPPGCGKTKLAQAIANETGLAFHMISAADLVSCVIGGSEKNIRELFAKAYRTAPSIVFIDEIDAIASKRENLQREVEKRMVTQLLTCMDESHKIEQTAASYSSIESSSHRPGYVLVIGATNMPDAIDSALRRPGRFDLEINLGAPDENARFEILSVITKNLRLEGSIDLAKIARTTPGFVGADLEALVKKAGRLAMGRIFDQRKAELSKECIDEEYIEGQLSHLEDTDKCVITKADFEEAISMIPSLRREGFSAIPGVKWEDIGGLDSLREEFELNIVKRIKYPEVYSRFGADLQTGFLLYGPPGCGKTLIAKAVANDAGASFIHIKGPELLHKYVGESERSVRTLFSRARACSPCILFFDEVDALTKKRTGTEWGAVNERLLNQLLIELDGADQRQSVFVIGATNRPEVMDQAVLRPGRFGKLLYVPLPSPTERGLILKAVAKKKPVDVTVDLGSIAQMEACKNFSGADLTALVCLFHHRAFYFL
ncbi:Cell division control protein 48 C isoform 1 [Tripterygium wilfordii]|uniref:Cell division control protein 48 C isoform 1 n=1 Tax=Tripterygium wilfordii TaxID=458696 RepID=A0A7J7CFJ3_TRIWF|nr:Cell division control protein 48 C isoform 1 [Tripterygium wilfordii]